MPRAPRARFLFAHSAALFTRDSWWWPLPPSRAGSVLRRLCLSRIARNRAVGGWSCDRVTPFKTFHAALCTRCRVCVFAFA